jgi:hypothetical protein
VIALLVCTSIIAGTLLGWFGHKASLRIQAWGVNMNAQDRIFQEAVPESCGGFQQDRKRPASDPGSVPPLRSHHLPFKPAH